MKKRKSNISPFIDLKGLGWVEMFVALMPILGAYYLGPAPFSFWILLLLSFVSMVKKKVINIHLMKPLIVFFVYFFIHEFVLLIFADSFNINNRIEKIVSILSVLFVVPLIDLNKFKVSVYLVSLVCMIGLLYQYTIIIGGGTVHPLEIPGLHMTQYRLLSETIRPSSFFMEPAVYSFYMYVPIVMCLNDKRYLWTVVLIISVFLTTSTTGLFSAFIILAVYMASQGLFKGRTFSIIVIVIALFAALLFTNYFEVGINKFESTNFDSNVRIRQGPTIVSTMHFSELIFGVPFGDVNDYVRAGRISISILYGDGTDVFMSTIWQLIFGLGIVGLFLYLRIFYLIAKKDKEVLPLVICLFVVMFTGSMFLTSNFSFMLIVLYSMKRAKKNNQVIEIE